MKNLKLLSTILLGFGLANTGFASSNQKEHSSYASSKEDTATFKVYGNCGMCKKTIEGSLKKVKGVKSADWNSQTKMMSVSFDKKAVTEKDIHKAIASVGYDTEKVKASDSAYSKLHGCCQYERNSKLK
jgi:copper chaperone CopZ